MAFTFTFSLNCLLVNCLFQDKLCAFLTLGDMHPNPTFQCIYTLVLPASQTTKNKAYKYFVHKFLLTLLTDSLTCYHLDHHHQASCYNSSLICFTGDDYATTESSKIHP